MNNISIFRPCIAVALGLLAAACSDEIQLGKASTDNIALPDGNVLYVTDNNGKRHFSNVEFRDNASFTLTLHTPRALNESCAVKFAYDPVVLEDYNRANGTGYTALPESMVRFANDGLAILTPGSTSATIEYTLTSDGSLDHGKTYVLPVRTTVNSGDAQLGTVDSSRLIFVRDLSSLPDATKYVPDADGNLVPAIKVFSCMEVNDANPLNNLSFTLDGDAGNVNNGKTLMDVVILFSANINYDSETGRVYIFNNENVQAILDKREHYIKPLQDRGIKVVLSILGNHDRSGIANLADETAKEFAKECKAMCDAYNLDGIFFDDEYSDYMYPVPEGFVEPSVNAAGRLVYEVKKAMPERLTVVYVYSRTGSLPNIKDLESGEIVKAGDYIDYALHDYGGYYDLASDYPGMKRSQMGLYSQEAYGYGASVSNLRKMRDQGYGAHMIYAMNPYHHSFEGNQIRNMSNCAKEFFDCQLVFDGITYPKDWK